MTPFPQGLHQLDTYLTGLNLETGWLVIFDQRDGLPPISKRTTTEIKITVGLKFAAIGPSLSLNSSLLLTQRDAGLVQSERWIAGKHSIDRRVYISSLAMKPIVGEGHAHLYIDGNKIARIYGEWYHLDELPEDAQMISVGLYANNHQPLAVDGVAITDMVMVTDSMATQE